MTETPKEYIITEPQLAGILLAVEALGAPKNNLLFKEIRSRPLPDHDKQVRDRALNELDTKIVIRLSEGQSNSMGNPLSKYEQHYQRALNDMRGMIETLRQGDKIC